MLITSDISEILKCYVYVYIDPRNDKPFYVGKGQGDRVFMHLNDLSDTQKVQKIAEIRASGHEPRIDFLRYGMTESEAGLAEAVAIELLGKENLTNQMVGFHRESFPRIQVSELMSILSAKPIDIEHKVILITINKRYRSGMSPQELYEATRGVWKIGSRRAGAEYAMAVYQGVVREVYLIGSWHSSGTLIYETRAEENTKIDGRWEFSGKVADDIRNIYVGNFVGKGGQNPIRYVNV
jgi:hypothetical protein